LLQEVHAKHPGVTILGPCGEPATSVVAAMQADDFVAVCDSLQEAQAVAATVYAYSCKWRFQLNSLKSAVMHVVPNNIRSQLTDSGIVWNGVPVPVVSEYCYLGLWFNTACTWDTHITKMLQKAARVSASLMPIWKSRRISVEVKRIVLLSCVRPIVEYGAEVWYPPLSGGQVLLGKIDKLQVDIIRSAMRCGKENPVVPGLLAEWGVKPLHMWLHQRTMEYYFRVQRMPVSRLPKQVVSAEWRAQGGATLLTGWQKYVHSLLCKYGVNVAVASGSAKECKNHIRRQVASIYADVAADVASKKSTFGTYVTHVHKTHVDSMRFKAPRPFLCSGCPSRGIELLMRVRLRCLCVHARTSKYGGRRANPTTVCPACGSATETLSHFVLECPDTADLRESMYAELRRLPGCAEKLRTLLAMTDPSAMVLRFVSDDVWGGSGVCRLAARLIADYLVLAWNHRNVCKRDNEIVLPPLPPSPVHSAAPVGRGADGDVAMA
jgi:hypothetical protein